MSLTFKPTNCLVSVGDNRGSVRLRWTYQGIRYNLNLGFPYDTDNLSRAISIAYLIDHDLKNNTFVSKDDYKVKNRKPLDTPQNISQNIPVVPPVIVPDTYQDLRHIFDFYCTHYHDPDSEVLQIRNNIKGWFDRTPPELLTLENADKFIHFLQCEISHKNSEKKGFSDKTIATGLRILKAGINFAFELGKVDHNPFVALYKSLNTSVSKEIQGYSPEQIQAIISAFQEDIYCSKFSGYKHSYYGDFILFRFLTGARPSEVVALTGGDIIMKNCKTFIMFNKRYVKGVLKQGLKNKKLSRLFPCNDSLRTLIEGLPCRGNGELLFKSVRGGYINTDSVNKHYWHPVIEGLVRDGVLPFAIPFYDQRHTFGSLICRRTTDIKTVATLMGNSPSTLYKYYLADDPDFDIPEF